jgi:hypothetical protein
LIPVTSFAGKTVAVFGLGGSGLASCHALKAGGAEVIAADDSADNVVKAAQAGFITADLRNVSWANFAALILTPGAPLTHPAPHWSVLMARQAGVEVIGDIELFCRERRRHAPDAPFVAIAALGTTADRFDRGRCRCDFLYLLVQRRPALEADIDLMPGRFLKPGRKLTHPGLGRLIEQDGDLGCVRRRLVPQTERAQQAEREKAFPNCHDILPMFRAMLL